MSRRTKYGGVVDVGKVVQGCPGCQICAHKQATTKECNIVAQACVHQSKAVSEQSQGPCHHQSLQKSAEEEPEGGTLQWHMANGHVQSSNAAEP